MKFHITSLTVVGNNKKTAILEFDKNSYLVYGPTDTGKSYIVECIRYCLGSGKLPKDVGFSEGYSLAILKIQSDTYEDFTIVRSLIDGQESIYKGIDYEDRVFDSENKLNDKVEDFLVEKVGIEDNKILIKAGKLGKVTANDLRRVCIFDEIETLDNIAFEGKDKVALIRNRSALSFLLTGSDDSEMLLVSTNDDRNQAKGQVLALNEQIKIINTEVPHDLTKEEVEESLDKISAEIEELNNFLSMSYHDLKELKTEFTALNYSLQEIDRKLISLKEANDQFHMLDQKYLNDINRLEMINVSASIVGNLPKRPCPICLTTIDHQRRHHMSNKDFDNLRDAARIEILNINRLREGLKNTLLDIENEILVFSEHREFIAQEIKNNIELQNKLVASEGSDMRFNLNDLTERKAELSIYLNSFKIIERLEVLLAKETPKTKRVIQTIERDISKSATDLCIKIKELLDLWEVPNVNTISFDEKVVDIKINQRPRVSYGKGKRGIFLTAYMISLMELNIQKCLPHLGFIIVDSPVVTYKDPKHGKNNDQENELLVDGELLPEGVKDCFYGWLATRENIGQVIVLENEELIEQHKRLLGHTEFFGLNATEDERAGFFPID